MLHNDLAQYLEGLTVTQGRMAGQPFPLFGWQKRFLRGAFGPGVIESGISLARGNGKSTFCAGLACAVLDGPLFQPRAEVTVVASSFDQAKIIFGHCLAFLRAKYGDGLEDKTLWRIQDSANKAEITNRRGGVRLKCMGSDFRRAHGAAPLLVLTDEPSQWEPAKSDGMISALRTGLGKVPDGRLIALGTRPADAGHWFAHMLAARADYSQEHAASVDEPPFQKKTWLKSNPSLPFMPDLEKVIRREARAARLDESMLASFRALRLNQGVSDVVSQLLIDLDVWKGIEGDALAEGKVWWGVDLGTSAAQSAIAAYWPDTGRLEALAAFPTEPDLAARGLRDGVGRLFEQCFKRGELITTGGAAVDVSALLEAALELFGPPSGIASDRWREPELRDALKAAHIPLAKLELRGMGFKDGAEDVRAFRRACLEGKVTPLPSLLLASAISEARTISDAAGNSKLAKNSQGGRRMRARDDAAAAAILAVGLASRQPKRASGAYFGLV